MSSLVSKKSSASKNLINQITLNCLMNTSQMMKLKNIKEKEDIASNRIKKMRKYNNELSELFKKLLDGKGSISLNDSFNEFIDKAMHHLDMLYDLKDQDPQDEDTDELESDELESEELEKLNDDIIDALNVDLNEIMNEYEKRKCLEQKQEEIEKELERERAKKEEEDEYDEDVEY